MRKSKVIVIFCALLTSCTFLFVPRAIDKSYTLCSDGVETRLDSLISINGYYYSNVFNKEEYINSNIDTSDSAKSGNTLFFFSDGRVAHSIWHYEHLKQIIDSGEISEEEIGRYYFDWGNYIVREDSIIVQYIVIPYNVHTTWQSYHLVLTIKNLNTLALLFRAPLHRSNVYNTYEKGQDNYYEYSDFVFEESSFHPKPNIPKRFRKLYECE